MTGRVYKIPMDQGTLLSSGKQDLWSISCGSSVPIMLEEIRLDPIATSVTNYFVKVTRFTTFTAASGGTSLTGRPANYFDAAASFSAQILTTAGISSTTTSTSLTIAPQVMDAGTWNLVNGWAWQPIDPDHRITCPSGGAISVSIETTTVTAATVNGCCIVREML